MVNTFDSQTSGITTDRLRADKAFSFSLCLRYKVRLQSSEIAGK